MEAAVDDTLVYQESDTSSDDSTSPSDEELLCQGIQSSKYQSRKQSTYQRFRFAVKEMIEQPHGGTVSKIVIWTLTVLILISVIFAIIETVPQYQVYKNFFSFAEDFFTIMFTMEILARMWISDSFSEYFSSPSNIIDIIVTLPWYVELVLIDLISTDSLTKIFSVGPLRTLRLVRMVRLLRVIKIATAARQSKVISVVVESLCEARTGAFVLVAFISISSVVFGTLMYIAEKNVPNGKFTSIPMSLWWAISTISTVGYGDIYPATTSGKFIASVTMLIGILIVSISVAIITTSFTDAYGFKCRSRERPFEAEIRNRLDELRQQSSQLLLQMESIVSQVQAEYKATEEYCTNITIMSYVQMKLDICKGQGDTFLRAATDLTEHLTQASMEDLNRVAV